MEIVNTSQNFKEDSFEPTYSDFDDSNEQGYQSQGTASAQPVDDEEALNHKIKVKSDVFTAVAAVGVNAVPIIIDSIKHRNDPVPYKVDKAQIVRLGISSVLPIIQTVDTLFNGERIQKKFEEKTPFKLGDVRNVINISLAYPSTHRLLNNFMGNVSRQANGKQQIEINSTVKRDTFIGITNTLAPYVVAKFSDNRLTFSEKMSSILPIKMFGGLVRRFADTNPRVRRAYDAASAVLKVADFGNKELSTAVRSNDNRVRGAQNTLGSALDIAQDLMGISRGRISRYGDYGNDWGGSGRWNSY